MRRFTFIYTVIGLALISIVPTLAVTVTTSPAASSSQPQADLAWFMTGLRDLGKSRDARLKLLPAQAKKILPVLEQLAAEKILITEVPTRQGRPDGQTFIVQGGAQGTGPTEKQRQEMQARQKKTAERIGQAIDSMDGMLRREQSDYIMNLDFDPAVYGLDRIRISQNGFFTSFLNLRAV